MSKKYLLPENGQFYKANLHCHSTISDGHLTVDELKSIYKQKGYSIVAFTDHDVLIPHPELNDQDFLALNGYELAFPEPNYPDKRAKTCHMNFIALDPDNIRQVCFYESKHTKKNEDKFLYDHSAPPLIREYDPEFISNIMKTGRDNGFYVTYNHPVWSLEGYNQYCNYDNMNAVEIFNFGCFNGGLPERSPQVYDDMLRSGKRIYCLSTDDNHNKFPTDSRHCDSFGGFVMIKADNLGYKTITDALVTGNFYSSEGPEIKELWMEDETIHIICSPADKITLGTDGRKASAKFAQNGELLTYACFSYNPQVEYIRLTVTDKNGNSAYTNAYFRDQL